MAAKESIVMFNDTSLCDEEEVGVEEEEIDKCSDDVEEEEEEEEDVDKCPDGVDEDDMDCRPTDVSFHRPTNTEELIALQQLPVDVIPTLFGNDGIISIEDLIIADTNDAEETSREECKHSLPLSKIIHLQKVLNLIAELISTEIDYVRDVGLLCDFLDECTYCSKAAVHSFVNSTGFIGE
jgi:hypothetical protein